MTSYSSGGYFNPAYHDSETLEIDRRSSSKTHHTNPYAGEDPAWRGDRAETHNTFMGQSSGDDAFARVPRGGWQEESWRGRESIPMGLISTRPGSPSWQHGNNHSTFQINPDSQYDRSPSVRFPPPASGHMTMRWRGMTRRRMSMFPNTDLAHLALTEDAIRNEMENEEQDLVKEFVALSTRDRIRAIRDLPMSFEEKKHIRSQVLAFRSSKQSRQFTCFADCSENVSLFFRRCGYSIRSARQTLELWQGIMKEIGGKFGTSVLSYFVFLKWLLMFNIFSFLVNFGFITIPLLVYDPLPNIPPNVSFRGLEILTGAESLSEKAQMELLTLSEKLKHFGVHLGSWLLSTGLAVGCGASIYYLCQYEQQRATDGANWSPLQEAETLLVPFVVSLMNLVVPLFYSLFYKFEHYSSQRTQIYALVVRNVLLRMSILGVLCFYWMNVVAKKFSCWESRVGQALYRLVIVDFLFLMLGSFFGEFLSNVIGTRLLPRLGVPEFDIARNVLELIYAQTLAWIGIYFSPLLPAIQIVKFFILFYLKKVSLTQNCQPPRRTGRAAQMHTTFIALLFFPFFVGALSMVAYTSWSLTPSEQCGPFRGLNNTFSVVGVWIDDLEEIPGSQWVVWIYQHVIRSELFYFLITLIILVIMYIFWQVTQGRKDLIGLLRQQIVNEGKDKSFLLDKLQNFQKSHPNKKPKPKNPKKHTKRRSDDHSSGSQSNSNAMVQALLARQRLEEEEERRRAGGVLVPSDISTSSAMMQAMLARQRAEDQEEDLHQMPDKHPSSSSALTQAMQARQRAEGQDEYYSTAGFSEDPVNGSSAVIQAMKARQRSEEDGADDRDDPASSVSSVMMQVMQARQRAEEEDRIQWVPAPPQNLAPSGSSALIQAMLARQQAQNEYDDGY
ncbi:transmembrane channel-like protein 5 isoform X2 [Seriola dumerili]|uniref:transmembrane channel-like protein 5 isoform X2 n=1 Tax=Seriola dumerili TaxID=41447 RepID=UPI000BBF22EF|nr:transmembrane channel-like protein 5 isoform X2 [Seriola dumerili]